MLGKGKERNKEKIMNVELRFKKVGMISNGGRLLVICRRGVGVLKNEGEGFEC